MAVSAPVKVGDVLADKFRVDKIVGAGGMGVVVEATHLVLQQRVALKFLNEQASHVPEVIARFEREARAAASLRSAHAVRIMDVGVMADRQPYIVMELLDGRDLASVIRSGERIGVETAIAYVRQACDAVGEAHERGIVHRDLKPGNLFLTTDKRGEPLVKVLDFGISKVAGEDLALTETAQLLGSPLYMSPEQLRASRDVDARTDVWSLGVILYEMLTGKVPFTADSMMELLLKIIESTPEPITSFRDDVPPYVIRAVEGCLVKERAQRIGSIDELLVMLKPDAPAIWPSASSPPSSTRLRGGSSEPDLLARGTAATVREGSAPNAASTNSGVSRPAPPISARATSISAKEPSAKADTTVSSAQRPSAFARWRWPAVGVIAVATVAGALVTSQRTTAQTPAAPVASVSASASSKAPVSTNPEAARAYEEGLAALRGCDWPRANVLFHRALAADPECTAAALHVLLMARNLQKEQNTERHVAVYRAVDARRARLSARDVAVLEALQPAIMREPPDLALTRERLVAASAAFPGDVTIALFATVASETDPTATIALSDRVIAIDPSYLDAMQLRARSLLHLGRTDEGRKQLERCVAVNPAAQCAGDLMLLLMAEGKCAPAEASGKSYVRQSAGSEEAYEYYALALAGNGADQATVAEAIHQSAAKGTPELAAVFEPLMLAKLDVLRGQLASADRRSLALMKLVDQRPDAVWHQEATFLRAELLREHGDRAGLTALASDFFARRRVWNRGNSPDWATPALLAALDEMDAMPHGEVMRRMDTWLTDNKGAYAPRWVIAAFGSRTARGADEAKAWLERGGPIAPINAGRTSIGGRGYAGRATLVAGDAPGAAKILADAARVCSGLIDPFSAVRAHLALGQAREAVADTPGACAAYGEVLKRWGAETPLGTTAKAAKARQAALKCAAPATE